MYDIKINSIPIVNIEKRERDIQVEDGFVTTKYGAMIRRNFRIDNEMLANILDSGTEAIKVFRYIASNVNSQTNKVILKSPRIIEYLKSYNIKADASVICKGIKKLCAIHFIIKANTLKVYENNSPSVYLVNPNYYVVSSPDVVIGRIQSDEREQHDNEMIFKANEQRRKREQEVIKLRLNRKNKHESKNQKTE